MLKSKIKNLNFLFIQYIILIPIILRAITKLDFSVLSLDSLFSIALSFQLFFFILLTSVGFKHAFNLNISKSLSVVLFFLFNFFISSLFAIFKIRTSFGLLVILSLIIFNLFFLIKSKNKIFKIIQIANLMIITVINLSNTFIQTFIYSRPERAGDVYNYLVPNIEKIFFFNIYEVFLNPVNDNGFFHINYSIFGNFYFAFLNKTMNLFNDFVLIKFIPYTIFFLSILFIFELKLERKYKINLIFLHISIIVINDWIRYQFVDSYLLEGIVSLSFAIIFFGINKYDDTSFYKNAFVYLMLGFFTFSKFFVNLLLIYIVLFKKTSHKLSKISYLIGPLNFVYFLIIYPPKNSRTFEISTNYSNFKNILLYWYEDKLFLYVIIVTIVAIILKLFVLNKLERFEIDIIILNLGNLMLIFILYIFIWSTGVEFDSSYRYFLQNYYLNISLLIFLTKKINSENKN